MRIRFGEKGGSSQVKPDRGRLEREQTVFREMTALYCRAHHGGQSVCGDCGALVRYAEQRIAACRFGEAKGFCSACTIHCFRPDRREQARTVMRYAGPRMLLHHPMMAIRHLLARG